MKRQLSEPETMNPQNVIVLQSIIDMTHRMDQLEKNLRTVQETIELLVSQFGSVPNSIAIKGFQLAHNSNTNINAHHIPATDYSKLSLQIVNNFEKIWYTHRPFPALVLHVVDEHNDVFTKADDWVVNVHLIDGEGQLVDHLLGQYENNRKLVIRKGIITICGLRFHAVSSTNGGYFNLQFEITSPSNIAEKVQPYRSSNITILSSRLFHQPKAPLHKLQPDDNLSMMPGIGRLYAKRFASLGIMTISHLANLNISEMTPTEQQRLNESLRKEKGTLTMTKLEEYVFQAQDIVSRSSDSHSDLSDSGSPPAKRLKSEPTFSNNSPDFFTPTFDKSNMSVFLSSSVSVPCTVQNVYDAADCSVWGHEVPSMHKEFCDDQSQQFIDVEKLFRQGSASSIFFGDENDY